ncbi:glycosyltransferase [Romboutsia sp. Marseille-P6047]|uniref:glycosyltransferase n=1 Tax=Romboutsia sp. Marseille-P6047 TaxID=2161817 RepID=UPI000822A239|nr:glycosyltransferase family A protein [Romboutsia sp. Marseille-P6047]SCH43771.1 Glycosyl transferase family 2 [uncultured Clostridium sp.]
MIYNKISVITTTKRLNCINNIISNFLRQSLEDKELIIVINNDDINISEYYSYTKNINNIYIYKLSENITLGTCLNFASQKCNYDIIAKFDDDDYYGSFYLNEVINTFLKIDCQVIGKTKTFLYFEKYKKLMLKKLGIEKSLVSTVLGSTLCFKIDVLDKVKFRDVNIREDKYFNDDCIKNGYSIYSTSIYNHIVFKHANINEHTFKYDLEFLIKLSSSIKDNINFSECFALVDKIK